MVKRLFVALLVLACFGVSNNDLAGQVPKTSPATGPAATPVLKPLRPPATQQDPQKTPVAPAKAAPVPTIKLTDQPQDPVAAEPAPAARTMSEKFLPAATKAWVSIPDADELDKQFHDTQFGALLQEERLKPFADHMESQVKKWINEQNVRLNLNVEDLHGVHSGEICFAGILPEDSNGEPMAGQHGLVFLMDVSETMQKARELQVKINAELIKRGATQTVSKINGVEYTKSVIDKPKIFRKKRYNFQAIVNGWMLVSNNEVVFRDVISRLANPTNIQPVETLAAKPSFVKVMTNSKLDGYPSHIRWFVDPFGYIQLANQIKDDEATSRVARDDTAKKLKDAGFDAFRGIGGNIAVNTADHEILHRTFTHAKSNNGPGNQQFFNLFDFSTPARELKIPRWAPEQSSSVVVGNWNFDRALKGVGYFYDAAIGQAGDFERFLHDFLVEPNLQLDVKKLVASLDDQMVIVAATEQPITAESERVVAGVPISGDPEFVSDSIRRALGDRAKVIKLGPLKVYEVDQTEESAEGGDNELPVFDEFPAEEEEEEDDQPKFELFERRYFVVVDNWLLVANNKDYLRKVLSQRQSKLAIAPDYLEVKGALSKLSTPSKVCWSHFGRLDSTMKTNYEMVRRGEMGTSQTVVARIINQLAARREAERAIQEGREVDPAQIRKQQLDGAKLPADFDAAIAPYLGPLGSVLESESDGWRLTGCFLKKKPMTEVVRKVGQDDDARNRK